jgi:DNA anti-recombination protein RmuC
MVERMSESEKTLLEVVAKLSKKMDAYDKRITSMGSDLSKVQSQVDLSMHSIQALQHEQIQLVQSMRPSGSTSTPRMTSGIIGSSPSSRTPSGAASPVPPSQHLHPEGSGIPKKTPSSAVNTGGFPHAGSESDN